MIKILQGDVLKMLRRLPDGEVNCCVTSPPYWQLRDYQTKGQMGMEKTPQEYIAKVVEVFREVRRVLRKDGTLWLNIGDSYNNGRTGGHGDTGGGDKSTLQSPAGRGKCPTKKHTDPKLKIKDMVGIPWRVAFALQADGWYFRSDIIWAKPNPMPESCRDRPTKAHEYLFLFAKSKKYFYDFKAIQEPGVYGAPNEPDKIKSPNGQGFSRKNRKPAGWADNGSHTAASWGTEKNQGRKDKQRGHSRRHEGFNERWDLMTKEEQTSVMRNKRSVWNIPTCPYPEAHFATFPPDLVIPCVTAGSPKGGLVLDPFSGSGTTGLVADRLERNGILIDSNPDYVVMAEKRIKKDCPMFTKVEVCR